MSVGVGLVKAVLIIIGTLSILGWADVCRAQTYGQPSGDRRAPAYVTPRLPLGYASVGQGHVVYAPNDARGEYRAPQVDYLRSAPVYIDAPALRVAPTQVYVVIPDIRVRPSDVTVEAPVVHFVPETPSRSE